jgi:hypothetical protein
MKRSSRPVRTPANLSESVHRRLHLYALAASATGVGMLASPPPADGKVVYTPAHDKLQNGVVRPIDLNHDRVTDFYLVTGVRYGGEWLAVCDHSVVPTYTGRQFYCKYGTDFPNAAILAFSTTSRKKYEFAAALPKGSRIGKGRQFGSMGKAQQMAAAKSFSSWWLGPWVDKGKGIKAAYIGLKFQIHHKLHYGWARLCVKTHVENGTNSLTATLTGYAYETIPNKAIVAGKTSGPDVITLEPASLGNLAAGASAISTWRSGK